MITREWMVMMARYNSWQNGSQFQAAGRLSDAQRREDLGAFFKSIQGTLNHILWADQMWLSRFGICPPARVTSLAESSNLHVGRVGRRTLAIRQRDVALGGDIRSSVGRGGADLVFRCGRT